MPFQPDSFIVCCLNVAGEMRCCQQHGLPGPHALSYVHWADITAALATTRPINITIRSHKSINQSINQFIRSKNRTKRPMGHWQLPKKQLPNIIPGPYERWVRGRSRPTGTDPSDGSGNECCIISDTLLRKSCASDLCRSGDVRTAAWISTQMNTTCLSKNVQTECNSIVSWQFSKAWAPARGEQGGQAPTLEILAVVWKLPGNSLSMKV